jgi:hypothetical protein
MTELAVIAAEDARVEDRHVLFRNRSSYPQSSSQRNKFEMQVEPPTRTSRCSRQAPDPKSIPLSKQSFARNPVRSGFISHAQIAALGTKAAVRDGGLLPILAHSTQRGVAREPRALRHALRPSNRPSLPKPMAL